MITLPSNVQWVGDIGVFVIEGDLGCSPALSHCCFAGCDLLPCGCCRQMMFGHMTVFVAPQAWAQYDKLCEACDGIGRITYMTGSSLSADDPMLWRKTCPDCRDGRQVWEVRWDCREDGHPDGYECPADCDQAPAVRATIEVVPVVGWRGPLHATTPSWGDRAEPTHPCILVINSHAILVPDKYWTWPDSGPDPLPLDPLPRPGRDFVVVVRKATQ